MLRQRLLAAVIVRDGRAVQSFGYTRYLPLGDVTCLVQNLDSWGADGIVVLDTDRGLAGPDFGLLKRLSALKLSTPLTYGGGIRNAEQARQAVQAGAERLVLDRALSESPDQLEAIAAAVGRQALIGSIPLIRETNGEVSHWRYWKKKSQRLNEWMKSHQWQNHVSELLTIDVSAEGSQQGPDQGLWEELLELGLPLLTFGGFSGSDQIKAVLQQPGVSAAVIGNALNYQEDSIRLYKDKLMPLPLRPHPDNHCYTSTKS